MQLQKLVTLIMKMLLAMLCMESAVRSAQLCRSIATQYCYSVLLLSIATLQFQKTRS